MNRLVIFLLILFCAIFKCNSDRLPIHSKGNSALFQTYLAATNGKNYTGILGKDLKVIFHLINTNGKLTGYYFYHNIGININLKGTISKTNFTVFELNSLGKTTATIAGNIKGSKIVGEWKSNKTGKILQLNLTQTDVVIPEIPNNLEGFYKKVEETQCKFDLKISKKNSDYFYHIKTSQRNLKGAITFYRSLEEQLVYINFEGIEWAENLGTLDENNEPTSDREILPIGIGGLIDGIKIRIQNSGNAMNYYTKFADCDDKFITLEKVK